MAELRFADGRQLALGKILCAARNYASHAREMGAEPPTEPVFFLKPATAVIHSGEAIVLPPQSADVQVETELAVILTGRGRNLTAEEAKGLIGGYAAFFDITARDLQQKAKQAGMPWAASKGFDTFAPIGDVAPAKAVADPLALRLVLQVNWQVRQDSPTSDMVFPPSVLLARASEVMTLEPGDVLATGTPAGVCTIRDGDVLEAQITGIPTLRCPVRAQ